MYRALIPPEVARSQIAEAADRRCGLNNCRFHSGGDRDRGESIRLVDFRGGATGSLCDYTKKDIIHRHSEQARVVSRLLRVRLDTHRPAWRQAAGTNTYSASIRRRYTFSSFPAHFYSLSRDTHVYGRPVS